MHFGTWLYEQTPSRQQEYAIEFLIYWMAYADNRYDPAIRKQVFLMKDPDARNLIKRKVLMKDAQGFAAAVELLQSKTSLLQRQQVLDLLMALLVLEHALTPVQNNLLRFLADAFGIGASGIMTQFERAFGHPMPAIPRPDKISWWEKLKSDEILRWDARETARQPEHIRYRILLGQPLSGDIDAVNVIRSFQLAHDRCLADRVSSLGQRESTLLLTQQKKFETARAALRELVA